MPAVSRLVVLTLMVLMLAAAPAPAQELPQTFMDWACNVLLVRGEIEYQPTELNFPRYLAAGDLLRVPPDQDRCKLGMSRVSPGAMLDVQGYGKVMVIVAPKTPVELRVASDAGRLVLEPGANIEIWTDSRQGALLVRAGRAAVECSGTVKVEHQTEGIEIWVINGSAKVAIEGGPPINVGFAQALFVPHQGEVNAVQPLPLGAKPPMELKR